MTSQTKESEGCSKRTKPAWDACIFGREKDIITQNCSQAGANIRDADVPGNKIERKNKSAEDRLQVPFPAFRPEFTNIMSNWFPRKKGIAMGWVTIGFPLSATVSVPVLSGILKESGLSS